MNPKKSGAVFIILMVALFAYGFGSLVNVVGFGNDVDVASIMPDLNLTGSEQISTIGDSSFKPAYIQKMVLNVTNNTTVSNVTNTTVKTNNTSI
ncbi:hypothetical protein [Methanobacterium aggregans]|uniref:hypothetical protein n=1 Tax=Methanobacterium aggregans TaxID=1615586 RepID=UPI001AEAAB32|nr:hypothetical protein [Methanobacterium aggregans]MBP2045490.1 hypothetical protein [Methanobacterium aggregans]